MLEQQQVLLPDIYHQLFHLEDLAFQNFEEEIVFDNESNANPDSDDEVALDCTLSMIGVIVKLKSSGIQLPTMDIQTFASVYHACSFGKHTSVSFTHGEPFSAVYGHYELTKHIVFASFQFDPGGFMRFLNSLPTTCNVMINNREQSLTYYLCNVFNMCIGSNSYLGQLHFRQKGSDKNHTGLSPHGISVIYGFVFTCDQLSP